MHNFGIYALIMLVAGVGIPIMAALNGGLGVKLQSAVLAAFILFAVGLLLALAVLLFTEGVPSSLPINSTPWYLYCGGLFVIFYVLSITWVAPNFGVSNAVSFVLLGQLLAMAFIDHYGFAGAPQYSMTGQRLIGLIVMAVGVLMVLNRAPTT
ncbi:MAG: DMT family transporter [Acidiferrobacterales bacterium]|nr:DMT family transporter [Acidiferrobacterales bacterium]